jgi:nucleoside-diphosphate-sugar epimerase
MSEIHVVFGAGQVGTQLAERLLTAGKQVRVVRRSVGPVAEGAERVPGDATDRDLCVRAADGAAAVYHCMNPGYDADLWARMVPTLMENLIAAAGASGARLVVLDNLYMYGKPSGPITPDTPFNPESHKGEIRAQASDMLAEAERRGNVQAAVGRASDFFGPGGHGTHFADRFWRPALAGKAVYTLFDPDATHSYNYIPDVAAGLAALGLAEDDVLGKTWMLPACEATTARELAQRLSTALGQQIRLAKTPRIVVKGLGLFMPIVKEIDEMLHQWEVPFVIDDRPFRERFGIEPTPMDEAARETVAWAREEYR